MQCTTHGWKLLGLWLLAAAPGLSHAAQYAIYNSLNGFALDGATSITASANAGGRTIVEAVDLRQGTLKVRAVDSSLGTSAEGDVRFGDTVTVNGLTAPTTVTLQLSVDGILSGSAGAVSSLFIGGPGLDFIGSPVPNVDFASNAYGGLLGSALLVTDVLQVSMIVTPAAPTFSFAAGLSVIAYGPLTVNGPSGSADFGNTATISLLLPAGTTFSSASGVLLQTVPLPASAGLLGPAIALLVRRGRRGTRGTDAKRRISGC
ncbi:MAG: hypothetical protein AB7P42_18060 [Gammaproteobacteria bacterium]